MRYICGVLVLLVQAGCAHADEQLTAPCTRAFINPAVAAREGDLQKCQELLRNGANINARDGNLVTPIMGAATYGRLETTDFLIKQRANINAQDR